MKAMKSADSSVDTRFTGEIVDRLTKIVAEQTGKVSRWLQCLDILKAAGIATKKRIKVNELFVHNMNRNKLGSMVIGGDSIYLLECQSAAYAILACNEAEKEADIKLIDMRMVGANGRLYLAGSEADVRNARNAAESALRQAGAS